MTDPESHTTQSSTQADTWRLAVVGGLLLAICAALAMLWITERHQRIRLERELNRIRAEQQVALKIQSLLEAPKSAPARAADGRQSVPTSGPAR